MLWWLRWSPEERNRSGNRQPTSKPPIVGTRADGSFREPTFTREEMSTAVPSVPNRAIQILQIVSIPRLAQLVSGIIARVEAIERGDGELR
jgi:hypothetical protein